jgi:hypothetical protein
MSDAQETRNRKIETEMYWKKINVHWIGKSESTNNLGQMWKAKTTLIMRWREYIYKQTTNHVVEVNWNN